MSIRTKIIIALSSILGIALLTSCSFFTPKLPGEVLPTITLVPAGVPVSVTRTATVVPASETPVATPFDLGGMVSNKPLSDWNGIPVMPGAITGGENSGTYAFTTLATPLEVVDFYTLEIPKLGWTPNAGNGTPQPGGLYMLVFFKDQNVCMVMIMKQEGVTLVMLTV